MRALQRSGSRLASAAGRMRTRLTPCSKASRQALSLGNMPPLMTSSLASPAIWSMREPTHDKSVGAADSGHVGEEDERVGVAAHRAGSGHFVGIDIVVFAVEAKGHAGEHRDGAHLPDRFEPARIGGDDLADEAEIGRGALFAGAEDQSISAGKANGGLSMRAQRGDEGLVDLASKNHKRSVACGSVGDAETSDEFTLLAHGLEGAGELHAATVNERYLMAVASEFSDCLGATVEQLRIFESGTA